MTKEEAAELVMLGQYTDCDVCGGTGYVSFPHTTVKMTCLRCNGLSVILRPHWHKALYVLGLAPAYSP